MCAPGWLPEPLVVWSNGAFLAGRAMGALAVAVLDLEGTGKRVPVVPVVTLLGAETAGTVQIRRLMADAIGAWFREGATGTTRMWGPQR